MKLIRPNIQKAYADASALALLASSPIDSLYVDEIEKIIPTNINIHPVAKNRFVPIAIVNKIPKNEIIRKRHFSRRAFLSRSLENAFLSIAHTS